MPYPFVCSTLSYFTNCHVLMALSGITAGCTCTLLYFLNVQEMYAMLNIYINTDGALNIYVFSCLKYIKAKSYEVKLIWIKLLQMH